MFMHPSLIVVSPCCDDRLLTLVVYCYQAVITDSMFELNSAATPEASAAGGCIASRENAAVSVTGSFFSGNSAYGGGAIGALSSASLSLSLSSFVSNTARNRGGAVMLTSMLGVTVEACAFISNTVADENNYEGAGVIIDLCTFFL